MAESLIGPAAAATGWLLTYLLHSTVLVVAGVAITRLVSLRARTLDVVWKLVVMAPLVTSAAAVVAARPGSGLHQVEFFEGAVGPQDRSWVAEGALVGVPTAIQLRARVVEPSTECLSALRSGAPRAGWAEDVGRACGDPGALTWFVAALGVWFTGMAVALAALGRRLAGLRAITASHEPADSRSLAVLRSLVAQGGSGTLIPSLVASNVVASPCVLPNGTIVLPRRCERELCDAELRAVLAHELAHVARRDPLWALTLRAVGALLWVQPLTRFAWGRALEAAELACDDWALASTGERYGLARSISRVAQWSMGPSTPVPDVSMAGRRGGQTRERVRRILEERGVRREPAWVRPIVAAALLVPMYWVPTVPPPSMGTGAVFVEEVRELDGTLPSAPTGRVVRVERVLLSEGPPGDTDDRLHLLVSDPD